MTGASFARAYTPFNSRVLCVVCTRCTSTSTPSLLVSPSHTHTRFFRRLTRLAAVLIQSTVYILHPTFLLTMRAFASLLTSKKKQTFSAHQLDASVHDQPRTSLPAPPRETPTGHQKSHGTRTASVSAAPLLARERDLFHHDPDSASPEQPRQDAHIPSRYLSPLAFPLISSTKGPQKSGKSKPSGFLQPRLNKTVAHTDVQTLHRSSWMTNDSDPFAGPSCSTPQQPTANLLFSVPPPPTPPRHEPASNHRIGNSPPPFKPLNGPGTNEVVLASDLYKRRRARSVGASGGPSPNFLVKLPPIPAIIPLRLTKDATPAPKQLPTPSTPSARLHSRVLSDSSTRSLTYKKSLPCIEGVWNDFLKEVEEDIESLTAGRSEKELPPPPPSKTSPPKRPLPLPACRPRSRTLGSSTIIERGLPSPGPLTPRQNCFPPMPIIVTPSISKEGVDSSPLPPLGMASQAKPTPVVDVHGSQSVSMLPYLGSESSMTTGSDLSLSLFPSPPSVPIRRPTDARGILRTQLTQSPHPPPTRPIPPTPNSLASTAVSQEVGGVLFTSSDLPLTPEIQLPVFSTIINSSEKPVETALTVSFSRLNGTNLHTPTKRPSVPTLHPTLHVPAPSTSSTASFGHSAHSHHSSTSSCTSVTTDYSSLLHSLEDARISVVSDTSSQCAHADPFMVPSTSTGSRMTIIDKSMYGHARADALGDLKALKSAAGLTNLNCHPLPSPPPRMESVELQSEFKSSGDTFEWGYAL